MDEQTRASVLLVDDNPKNLLTLEAALGGLGYDLVKAESGEAALKCLLRQDFAVILLDVNMPGMDGFETATIIRSRERMSRVPIIFVTAGSPTETNIFQGYSVGAVDYILTPIIPEILRAKVSVFVDLFRKTEEGKRQGELLREAERKEHERALAEARRQVEIETYRVREEALRREKEREAMVADVMTQRANELERSNGELRQFAHVTSHDLQEPLRMVTVYLQRLERHLSGNLDADGKQYLGFAVEGARRMHALIKDLLEYSRVGSHPEEPQMVDCNAVFDTVVKDLQITISENEAIVTRADLPRVFGHASEIAQLLQNLIGNAIKYKGQNRPLVELGVREEGTRWLFFVKDNGIGIDPKYRDRIFVIFQRLHTRELYPGTGIGLAICKKIVERHGGKIWVDSEEGKGATFYFTMAKGEAPSAGRADLTVAA